MPERNDGCGKIEDVEDGQSHHPQRQGDCGATCDERSIPGLAGNPEKHLAGAQDKQIPFLERVVNLAAQKPRRKPHGSQDQPDVLRVMIPCELAAHQKHRHGHGREAAQDVAADVQ